MNYTLELPEQLLDHEAPIWESKGWVSGVVVVAGTRTFNLTFYEPVRLGQEIEHGLAEHGFFAEQNLVVVRAVTAAAIRAAVEGLAANDFADAVAG